MGVKRHEQLSVTVSVSWPQYIPEELWEIVNLNFALEILFKKSLLSEKSHFVCMCVCIEMYVLIFSSSYFSFKQFSPFNTVIYELFTKAWKF